MTIKPTKTVSKRGNKSVTTLKYKAEPKRISKKCGKVTIDVLRKGNITTVEYISPAKAAPKKVVRKTKVVKKVAKDDFLANTAKIMNKYHVPIKENKVTKAAFEREAKKKIVKRAAAPMVKLASKAKYSRDELVHLMFPFAAKDSLRPVLNLVWANPNGELISTDAHIIVVVQKKLYTDQPFNKPACAEETKSLTPAGKTIKSVKWYKDGSYWRPKDSKHRLLSEKTKGNFANYDIVLKDNKKRAVKVGTVDTVKEYAKYREMYSKYTGGMKYNKTQRHTPDFHEVDTKPYHYHFLNRGEKEVAFNTKQLTQVFDFLRKITPQCDVYVVNKGYTPGICAAYFSAPGVEIILMGCLYEDSYN